MVLVSVGVHLAMVGLGAAWLKWGKAPLLHLTPVTTVDLVGAAPMQPVPVPREEPPRPEAPARAKKSDSKAKEPARAEPPSRTAMPTHDAKQVADAVSAMRARMAAESTARQAIEEKRAQAELGDMLRKMRDRQARQVNLAAVGPVSGPGGAYSGRRPDASLEELKYARELDDRIRANWTQPVGNAKALVAVVRIKIQRDGYVPASGVEIMRGSGNAFFDKSVERAIMKASPLPVPSDQLRGGETYFDVLLNFYGTGGSW